MWGRCRSLPSPPSPLTSFDVPRFTHFFNFNTDTPAGPYAGTDTLSLLNLISSAVRSTLRLSPGAISPVTFFGWPKFCHMVDDVHFVRS